jgi:hypothetical protein
MGVCDDCGTAIGEAWVTSRGVVLCLPCNRQRITRYAVDQAWAEADETTNDQYMEYIHRVRRTQERKQ